MSLTASHWLRAQVRPLRRALMRGVAIGSVHALLMCMGAWLLAHVLNAAIFEHRSLAALWPLIAGIAVVALLRGGLLWWQRMIQFDTGSTVVQQVHRTLDQQWQTRGPHWAAQQSSGDIVTRVVDGVDALAPYYSGYMPQMYLSLIVPSLVLLCVLTAEPWSALVLLGATPLLPIFMILVGKAAATASERRWTRLRRLGARFMDALSGLTTLRLYGAAAREERILAAAGDAYRRDTMGVLRVAFLSALVLEFFATVSIAVVAVLIGFRLLAHKLAFEPGMFALLLAPEFFAPLRALGTQRHQKMEATTAAENLLDWLTSPENASTAEPAPSAAAQRLERRAPRISMERVSFAHTAERNVLEHVDFQVPAGSRLTIVGESGSGKSTLLNLLMGFATPEHGRILINDQDLADIDREHWRSMIMWVSQRPYVFHGSVRENLLIARPDTDELSLRRAIQFASLESVISRLPQGLDTLLGEHGAGLSGGELQRMTLARAWLRDAPVLLLDEPTQHLDIATAHAVNQALETLGRGRTVIRVAHRLHDLADDDMIAVFAHGACVENGRADELRSIPQGYYASLLAADRSA